MPILADGEQLPTWVSILIALVGGGVLVALGKAVQWLTSYKKQSRKDAIGEWQEYADKQQERIDSLQKQVDRQQDQMNLQGQELLKSRVAEAKCQGQVSQLQADVRVLNVDIRRLQERMGDTPPGVTRPVVIVADITGKIFSVSPEIGAMFHWLPRDLTGQNITELMPKTIRRVHKRALEMMAFEKRNPDPDKPVLSYGLTKDGVTFPVMINLSGWSATDGTKYINAEIRRRGDSDSQEIFLHGPTEGKVILGDSQVTPPEGTKLPRLPNGPAIPDGESQGYKE